MIVTNLNCLREGETLEEVVRRECAIGFDVRFSRRDGDPTDHDTITCDPCDADLATLYALTDLGEAIAVHDVELSSNGADELGAVARAIFVAMVNARRDPPDAAQRHEAEQAALTTLDRIS